MNRTHKEWQWILAIVMMVPIWLVHLQLLVCRCWHGGARGFVATILDIIILGLLILGRWKKHPASLLYSYLAVMILMVPLIKFFVYYPFPIKIKG